MAQANVRVTERPNSPTVDKTLAQPRRAAEVVSPIEHLQRRFDEAFDRADELGALVQAHQQRGIECSTLLGQMKQAEVDKRAALAALRKVRWMQVKPSA